MRSNVKEHSWQSEVGQKSSGLPYQQTSAPKPHPTHVLPMLPDLVDDEKPLLVVGRQKSLFETLQIVLIISIPPLFLLGTLLLAPQLKHQAAAAANGFSSDVPSGATKSCQRPFGALIGVAHNVPAFSNCNSDYISNESNYVNVSLDNGTRWAENVYTGMPWQCVEYARRFWVLTEPHASFGSVDGASDIWTTITTGNWIQHSPDYSASSSSGSSFDGGPSFTLLKFANLNASSPPSVGDLLVYPVQGGGFPFGHVAAVVGSNYGAVSPSVEVGAADVQFHIQLGEQNWDSYPWEHEAQNYSRVLTATFHALTRSYSVKDPEGEIAGWVRRPSVKP